MGKTGDALLPLLGGLIAAASPMAGRAVVAGGRLADSNATRRRKEELARAEAEKAAAFQGAVAPLIDSLGDNPEAELMRARLQNNPSSVGAALQALLARSSAAENATPDSMPMDAFQDVLSGLAPGQGATARVTGPQGVPISMSGRGVAPAPPPEPPESLRAPTLKELTQGQEAQRTRAGMAQHARLLFGQLQRPEDKKEFQIRMEYDPKGAISWAGKEIRAARKAAEKDAAAHTPEKQIAELEKELKGVETKLKRTIAAAKKRGDGTASPQIEILAPDLVARQRLLTSKLHQLRGSRAATKTNELAVIPPVRSRLPGISGAGALLARKHLGG